MWYGCKSASRTFQCFFEVSSYMLFFMMNLTLSHIRLVSRFFLGALKMCNFQDYRLACLLAGYSQNFSKLRKRTNCRNKGKSRQQIGIYGKQAKKKESNEKIIIWSFSGKNIGIISALITYPIPQTCNSYQSVLYKSAREDSN